MSLELVSTDDLLAELMKRWDHSGFIGIRIPPAEGGEINKLRVIEGNAHVVAGLCHDLATWSLMKRGHFDA